MSLAFFLSFPVIFTRMFKFFGVSQIFPKLNIQQESGFLLGWGEDWLNQTLDSSRQLPVVVV